MGSLLTMSTFSISSLLRWHTYLKLALLLVLQYQVMLLTLYLLPPRKPYIAEKMRKNGI